VGQRDRELDGGKGAGSRVYMILEFRSSPMIWMPGSHTDDVCYVQVLSADWDKYSEFTVFSGGVDRCIRAWDLRRPDLPIMAMYGHGYVPAPVIFN
jgi:hypothetical protein